MRLELALCNCDCGRIQEAKVMISRLLSHSCHVRQALFLDHRGYAAGVLPLKSGLCYRESQAYDGFLCWIQVKMS